MSLERKSSAALLERLRSGEVRALARTISLVEGGGPVAQELLTGCRKIVADKDAQIPRIGITGAPGVGKSTLVDRMAHALRAQGKTVGVVAVDPTSPYTGGALLGDRIRMQGFSNDANVYIRSMASRGIPGGLGLAAAGVCLVMEAAGREVILIETVGVGQDEVAVAQLAGVVVLVLVPGMGDAVQAMKAGVMEMADVFAINKADRGGAEAVEAEIVGMQGLAAAGKTAAVVRTAATTGDGVAALMEAVWAVAAAKVCPPVVASPGWPGGLALDHLGVAVRSIAETRAFYEGLGLRGAAVETVEHEGVRVLMLPLEGSSRIELLEALGEETVLGRFLARRGEGLHHVALRVGGIDALFARLREQGTRLASDAVRVGAGGHRYFFVHPASTGGVLVELVEESGA